MTVVTSNWIRWGITLILTIFHLSVACFIFIMIRTKHKVYNSSFYILYLIAAGADILTVINNFLAGGIILFDSLKPWFFEHPMWDTITWLISGYLIFFQCFTHTAIAVNRFWMSFELELQTSHLSKIGRKLIWLLPLIPLPILSVRFAGHSIYFYDKNGELASGYVEEFVVLYHGIAGPAVVIFTSIISFFLAIITIVRYRYLYKNYSNISFSIKHDLLLFSHATILLLLQLALFGYYVMRFIGGYYKLINLQSFALIYFYYVNDGFSLCGPIALLLICNFIRRDYLKFIFRRNQTVSISLVGINSPVQQLRNTPQQRYQ